MTSDGSIIVEKQLPRLRLPNDGTAILGIEIRDAGTPSKSTSVTAEIDVESESSLVLIYVTTPMQKYCDLQMKNPDIFLKTKYFADLLYGISHQQSCCFMLGTIT